MKAYNLAAMMHRRGHEVLFYGVAGSTPECSEFVETVSRETWASCYGKHKPTDFYAYDQTDACYQEFYRRTQAALRTNVRPWQDLVLCPWGWGHKPACDDVPTFVVESGIGYPVTFSQFRVFESYAWMHMFWGKEDKWGGDSWYDTVIPNYFDPAMFDFRAEKGDYLLYLGRLNADKGVQIAVDVTREIGAKLIICGQGDPAPFLANNPHVTYHEPVAVEGRRELLSHARALMAPTRYVEPWGGVVVEAQASGTPVITTDWGGFRENVLHGVTGYRCRTHDQFVWAAEHIGDLSPVDCRDWAIGNYSMERVAPMYEEYFQSILDLSRGGWYQRHPERLNMDCYAKATPSSPAISTENPLPVPPEPIVDTVAEWQRAQKWEADWWGTEDNARWDEERRKQLAYARMMGIPPDLDMGNRSVVDLGAGPMSLLLRVKTTGRRCAVDPLPMAQWAIDRYASEGIEFHNEPAETWRRGCLCDEAWLYNVLQHVQDPARVLETAKASARSIRIFEWTVGTSEGHLHALTEAFFREQFPQSEWLAHIWNTGNLWTEDGLLTSPYIALHLERRQ